jgi:hypothetical protein
MKLIDLTNTGGQEGIVRRSTNPEPNLPLGNTTSPIESSMTGTVSLKTPSKAKP